MKKNPKYIEIEQFFIDKIKNGELLPDQQIPSEASLCEQFSASRMTVNKAMTNLSNKGYIRRVPGNGSFVYDRYTDLDTDVIRQHSISDEIRSYGMTPGSELLEYKIIQGKDVPQIASELEVKDDEYIHYFLRLRTGDGKPVVLSYTYIVYDLLPSLDIRCLQDSFNTYLNEQGIKRTSGYTVFSATLPNKEQAEIIGTDNIALLRQKIFWNYRNKPFEITYHYYFDERMSVVINRNHDDSQDDFYKKTFSKTTDL
ncbi:MAG: GntR family transcriptional regulator [Erysipelotrichaceae bacterium]|nr:GntR family transcriptional regulator [Erysipelotrichaceae bacterium]